ncbi:MAG: hypothetical protein ACOZQL_25890 [Myxococcota bacterium]
MITALLVLLSATPVSLQLDLSEATRARIGLRVQQVLEQRLAEEGFELRSGARVKLLVEELHGTLRLTASAGDFLASSELRPSSDAWRDELALELAMRLSVLAHEAAESPAPPPPERPAPPPEEPPGPSVPPSEPPPTERVRVGAAVRLGVIARPPAIDPTFELVGFLRTGTLQPMMVAGLTVAPAPRLTVLEVPLGAGLRLLSPLGAGFSVLAELHGGLRLHLPLGADAVAALDAFGSLGIGLLHTLGPLKLGARLSAELGTARRQLLGAEVLWGRELVAVGAQLHLER